MKLNTEKVLRDALRDLKEATQAFLNDLEKGKPPNPYPPIYPPAVLTSAMRQAKTVLERTRVLPPEHD